MAHSRRNTKCTEPAACGAVVLIDSNNESYPQAQKEMNPIQCPMEHCTWIGEAKDYEDHRENKHPPFAPVEYVSATHMVVSKEDIEKANLLQVEAGKLKHNVTCGKKKLKQIESEAKKARDELRENEDRLTTCCGQILTLQSQSAQNASPVIPQRKIVVPNQLSGGANSTASLGRASQPEPPPQERCSTLDAKDSGYQQLSDMMQEDECEYGRPEPQTEQEPEKEALAVGYSQSRPFAVSDKPPPLPPKPKRPQDTWNSSDDVPPQLPPKPMSSSPPTRVQQLTDHLPVHANTGHYSNIPPPRPPKPGHAVNAPPAVPRRRARKSPSPSSKHSTVTQRRDSSGSDEQNTSTDVSATVTERRCSNCAKLQENCAKLQEKNGRLTCLLKKEILKSNNSNTCPPSFRDPNSAVFQSRPRTTTF